MHINEVQSILSDSLSSRANGGYELKKYNDHLCCISDFVLLNNGLEYAYIKFDERGNMARKEMNINKGKMGTARFYIVIKDSDEFIPSNLPCRIYPKNDINHPFDCSTDDLLSQLENYQSANSKTLSIEAIADFFEKSFSSLIRGRMHSFISKIREETNLSNVIEDHDSYFMFTPQYERLFFCSLLGSTSGMPKRVCRYTSLASLFRTLSDSQQSMCSVACMNDRSETDYARQFISDAISHSNVFQRLDARTYANQSNSNYFILSGSRMGKKDDLNMWRLYGDDSKGVCLWYDVDEMPEHFFIAKVSYAKNDTHAELNYLANKLSKDVLGRNFEIRNLESWLHFFKPAEYAVEEEARLLFEMKDIMQLETFNGKWIFNSDNGIVAPITAFSIGEKNNNFPLILSKIVLGPNCPEKELNKGQLHLMIQQKRIKTTADFEITTSNIRSYRI